MMATQQEREALAVGVFVGRVRALQAMHFAAHQALVNWGHWSADRRGIFPTMAPPAMWDQFKRDENESWGEEPDKLPEQTGEAAIRKAEAAPRAEYDEKTAVMLDERLHGYGGLSTMVREALHVAYVSREIPEQQFPRLAGCTEDAFCERLSEALGFVERFL